MLPGRPRRDFDSLRIWFQLAKTFHQRTSHDRRPAIGRLHNFDSRVDGRTDGLAEVGVLTKSAYEKYRLDLLLGGSDLATDQCYDFVDDGIEDGLDLGAVHLELTASDSLGWIVGQSGD